MMGARWWIPTADLRNPNLCVCVKEPVTLADFQSAIRTVRASASSSYDEDYRKFKLGKWSA